MNIPDNLKPIFGDGADTAEMGKRTFEGMYAQAQGNLTDLQNRSAAFANAVNMFWSPTASESEKIAAIGAIVYSVSSAVIYGAAYVGLASAAIVSAVPVIGLAVGAIVAVAAAVFALYTAIVSDPNVHPADKVDLTVMQIPQPVSVDGVPITDDVAALYNDVSRILWTESLSGQNDAQGRLALSQKLGNDAGTAEKLISWSSLLGGVETPDLSPSNPSAPTTESVAWWNGRFPTCFAPPGASDMPSLQRGIPNLLVMAVCAAFAAGLENPPALAYMFIYQSLVIRAWVYKASGEIPPQDLLDAQGVMLKGIAANPVPRSLLYGPSPMHASQESPGRVIHDLNFYVSYYLWEKDQAVKAKNVSIQSAPITRAGLR